MQKFNFKSWLIKSFLLAGLCLTVFSFFAKAGGDYYAIYINKQLLLEQYVSKQSSSSQNLQLDKNNSTEYLSIYYTHCGATGKGRRIIMKNNKNEVLKEWKFADATGANASMKIQVKDILELRKKNTNAQLSLYYFSSEKLPQGKMLAFIKSSDKAVAEHQSEKRKNWSLFAAVIFVWF